MTRTLTARLFRIIALTLLLALPQGAAAQDDRELLQGFIEDNLSTEGREVRIEGFEGALSSKATLDLLTIADEDGIWLTLKDVTLDWSRLALLRGRLQVSRLSAAEILLPRLPKPQESVDIPDPEASGFSLPELPVAVNVDEIAIDRIVLGEAILGQEVSMSLAGSLQLDDGVGRADLNVIRLDREGDRITLDASYSNTDQRLAVDLLLTEDAGGLASSLMSIPGAPPLTLSVEGDAPLADYTAQIALETDGQERLGGTVTVQSPPPGEAGALTFSADIGGDIAPLFAPDYRAFFGRDIALVLRGSKPAEGGLGIETLSLKSAALTLDGSLQLGVDNWPQSFDLTGRLASQEGGPVLLPLSGPKTTLEGADLALRYDRATGDEWRLSLEAEGLEREDLTLGTARIEGGGTLRPGGADAPGHVDGALDLAASGLALTDPDLKAALGDSLTGDIVFDWTRGDPFRLTSLALNGQDFSVDGSAEVTGLTKPIAPRLTASVALKAQDLARFAGLAGTDLEGGADVQIDVAATPTEGTIELSVNGSAQDLAVGQPRLDPLLTGRTDLTLEARRGKDGTFLDVLRVTSPETDLNASAAWKSDGSTADLALTLEDAGLVVPGLSGAASLSAQARQDGDTWTIRADGTGPGEASLTANGTVDIVEDRPGLFDGEATLSAANLAPYSELAGRDLGGAASVQVDARGDIADLSGEVQLRMTGQDVSVGLDAVDNILKGEAAAQIDAQRSADGAVTVSRATLTTPQIDASAEGYYAADGAGEATLDMTGNDLTVGIPQVDRLLSGKSTAHVEAARSSDGRLTLKTGQLETPQIDASAEGFYAPDGAAEATVDVTGTNISIGIDAVDNLLRGRSTLKADVTREADGTLIIDQADLDTPQVTAEVSGTIGTDGNAAAQFDARLANVALLAPGIPGPATATGTIRGDGSGYIVDADATGPAGIAATVSGRIGNDGMLALDAQGKAPLALADPFISPRSLSGIATFDLSVNGPPALSSITGTVTTRGAGLALPKLKLALEGISADIRLTGGAAQLDIGAGVSSGGRLALDGRVGLSAPFQADLTAQLQNVGITDPGLYSTTANGRVTLTGPLTGGATIAGTVNLGEVNIQVPSGAITSGAEVPGLVHVNEPAPVHRTRAFADMLNQGGNGNGNGNGGAGVNGGGPAYGLDVTVNAPSRIFVRGRGLDAELGGSLRLRGTTQQVIPEGQFDLLRGRLDILGKRLDLTEGYLRLQGSFVPFLHLVAQAEAGDVQVFITIDGPADEPDITFSSQPDLPEDQIVSQLIFGRDLSQISAFQAIQLASAVATLAGKSGGGVVGQLRKGFGLDNLDVTTGEGDTTEVTAGKYLSENIYSEVEVDSEGQTQINLNLQINKRLKAKGSFGAEGNSGLGIYFEKDY